MKKIVYCGQFMDFSGYGIAARKYLEILDMVAENNNIDLKIYTALSPFAPPNLESFSEKEQRLINKYSFTDDASLKKFIDNNDYECIWHMPTPMALFADDRFKTPSNISEPALLKIIKASRRNHHLVVWETTDISTEWKECIEWFKPHSIITACEMNVKMYSNYCDNVLLAPHPIFDIDNVEPAPLNLPYAIDDKFVVFSMSQWTYRKGFENKKNNIILIPDYIHEANINWLYKNSDIFALLPRGEGFGLTIFESILNGLPVLVPAEGGHVDYISDDNKFMVDGMWDTCVTSDIAYPLDSEWFESNISSARKKLRLAYNLWKENKLSTEGEKLKNDLIKNINFDPVKIAQNIIDFVTKEDNKNETEKVDKRTILKKKLSLSSDLQTQMNVLKDSYKDQTVYILSCGPSLGEYDEQYLKEFLSDKPTFAIKQAYNKFAEVTDVHLFNCANLPDPIGSPVYQHYKYDEDTRPIIVASSNYDVGKRWHPAQKQDVFFKIPIRTEINNEFITITKKFEDFLIDNNLTRPCGPGIMYETVFYMAAHMGFKEIICLGWDLRQEDPDINTYDHFYGHQENMFNRGDILDWEIKATREASKELYYWLKEKEIDLKIASSSAVYENIERITL